jgi:hypothetical protein
MVSDVSTDELTQFAERINLNPKWIQLGDDGFAHFDLNKSKREAAIRDGAIPIGTRELVGIIRKYRKRTGQTMHWMPKG